MRATIEVRGRHIGVHPREADGAERDELWRLVNDNYYGYQVYQQRAGDPGRAARAGLSQLERLWSRSRPNTKTTIHPAEPPATS